MTKAKTVEDIMTRRVIFVREEDNMLTIREGMEAFGLRHIPVLDNGKIVGLLSHRDVLRFANSQYHPNRVSRDLDDRRSQETFVADVMTRDVRTVPPTMPLFEAAKILVSNKFGCLAVTAQDGTLLGLVTEHDLVKAMAHMLETDS